MINTLIQETQSQKNSVISASSSQLKLITRTSKSKSLKIKRSDSESQFEKSFPTYFIKKVPKFNSKNNEQQLQTTDVTPAKVIKRKGQHQMVEQKKRQPTPVKSYREIQDNQKTYKKQSNNAIDMQKQMQIHELEKKLQCESKIRIMFEHRAKQFENQVSIQAKKVKSLEKELQIVRQKDSLLKKRITEIEGQLENKSNDLKSTKSNLQKLKQNIKEARDQEYQSEIKKVADEVAKYKSLSEEQNKLLNSFKNENTSLKMQIARIKTISEQAKLKVQEQSKTFGLKKQIEWLKSQLKMSKTQKQLFLEHKLSEMHAQMQILKKVHQSRLIQIDFLNRKKHDELEKLRTRKGEQIRGLRIKFAALMDEYKSLKHDKKMMSSKDKEQKSNYRSIENKSVQKRQNRFVCPTKDRSEQDYLCFSLSPDMK